LTCRIAFQPAGRAGQIETLAAQNQPDQIDDLEFVFDANDFALVLSHDSLLKACGSHLSLPKTGEFVNDAADAD
jgi:hypothetical protein